MLSPVKTGSYILAKIRKRLWIVRVVRCLVARKVWIVRRGVADFKIVTCGQIRKVLG